MLTTKCGAFGCRSKGAELKSQTLHCGLVPWVPMGTGVPAWWSHLISGWGHSVGGGGNMEVGAGFCYIAGSQAEARMSPSSALGAMWGCTMCCSHCADQWGHPKCALTAREMGDERQMGAWVWAGHSAAGEQSRAPALCRAQRVAAPNAAGIVPRHENPWNEAAGQAWARGRSSACTVLLPLRLCVVLCCVPASPSLGAGGPDPMGRLWGSWEPWAPINSQHSTTSRGDVFPVHVLPRIGATITVGDKRQAACRAWEQGDKVLLGR